MNEELAKELKKNYLEDLGPNVSSELDDLALTILDQAIENILEGQATIEGRKPETRREYYALITLCSIDAKKQLIEIARSGAIPNSEVQEITVAFRGKKFKMKVRGATKPNNTDIA